MADAEDFYTTTILGGLRTAIRYLITESMKGRLIVVRRFVYGKKLQ